MPTLKVCEPEKIVFTLTYSMELEGWKMLRQQFKKNSSDYASWPASKFVSAIIDMSCQAERAFYPSSKDGDE